MATLNPKLEIKLYLDPAGFVKGANVAKSGLKGIESQVGSTTKRVDGFKKSLGAMWRITGGILLFNVIRHITHAVRDLIGTVIDFDEQMRNVNSVAQLGEKAYADLIDQVIQLDLDPRVREGPASLAAGLYLVTSAGYSATDALVIMKQAAFAASAGMTTSAVAADVIMSTLGAYSMGVEHAEEVTNSLFQIVNISKYTFPELASAMDSVTPSAAALGIGVNEIGAALAVFAKHGVDAQTATVQMNAILTAMLKPTDAMKEALADLGYETGQQMLQANGFVGTMKIWAAVVDDDAGKAAALFGDVRALRGEMNLVNDDGVLLTQMLEKMGEAQDGDGAMAKALVEQMKSVAFQMDVFRKNLQILASLGFGMIAPYLNKVLLGVNTFVAGMITAFRHFRDKGYTIFGALRAAIKKNLQEMFGSDVVTPVLKFFDQFVHFFYQVKAVVVAVAPYVMDFLKFLVDHFNILAPAVTGAVIAMKAFNIVMAITNAIIAITSIELAPLTLIIIAIAAVGALLAVAWVKNWGDIQGKTHTAIKFIGKWLGKLWEFIQPAVKIVKEFGKYLHDVATGDIRPFGEELKKLPGWLQPIAWVLGRVIKTLRVFIKTWQDKGFLAAIKTIPMQMRAFGRAIANLLDKLGFEKLAVGVKAVFYDIARIIKDVIDLIDDVAHGRWNEVWHDLRVIAVDAFWFLVDEVRTVLAFMIDLLENVPWTKIWMGLHKAIAWLITDGGPLFWRAMKFTMGQLWNGAKWVFNNVIVPGVIYITVWFLETFAGAADWLYQAGNDIIKGLADGITFAFLWLVGWFGKLPGRLQDFFFNSGDLLYQAGNDLIGGLAGGISFAWNWMVGWLSKLWDSLPKWLKKLWAIASPSKVFAAIGKEIPAGIAVGIKAGMGEVHKAVKQMDGATGRRIGSISTPRRTELQAGTTMRNNLFGPGSIIIHGALGQNEEVLAEKVAHRILRASDDRLAGQK